MVLLYGKGLLASTPAYLLKDYLSHSLFNIHLPLISEVHLKTSHVVVYRVLLKMQISQNNFFSR
jgi:glucose-6-phosphate-specific signal transduction histidine kinase